MLAGLCVSFRRFASASFVYVQAWLMEFLADEITKMQAEADTRTNLMLESLLYKVHEASKRAKEGATNAAICHDMPDEAI